MAEPTTTTKPSGGGPLRAPGAPRRRSASGWSPWSRQGPRSPRHGSSRPPPDPSARGGSEPPQGEVLAAGPPELRGVRHGRGVRLPPREDDAEGAGLFQELVARLPPGSVEPVPERGDG